MDRYETLFPGDGFREQPSSTFGLYRELRFSEEPRNKREDFPVNVNVNTPEHFTVMNQQVLRRVLEWERPRRILEIGVHRPRKSTDGSSTATIFEFMPRGAKYLGVDSAKKRLPLAPDTAHFLQCQSQEKDKVLAKLRDLGMYELDLIMIDGLKSPGITFNDWSYSALLRKGGWVVMHDTSWHSGPILLWDCIDKSMFLKHRWENGQKDYGIGAFQRRV